MEYQQLPIGIPVHTNLSGYSRLACPSQGNRWRSANDRTVIPWRVAMPGVFSQKDTLLFYQGDPTHQDIFCSIRIPMVDGVTVWALPLPGF